MTDQKKKPIIIAANRELRPWEEMLVETIKAVGSAEDAMSTEVDSACVLTKLKDGHVMTGFCNMECFELAEAAVHILFDAIDKFIEANIEKYVAAYEDGEFDDEEDEPIDE